MNCSLRVTCLLLALIALSCSGTSTQSGGGNAQSGEKIPIPIQTDYLAKLPETKYFYTYVFKARDEWETTPQWVLGNLNHFGIRVTEAWYNPWASKRILSETEVEDTLVPPTLIVGMARQDSTIFDHRFVQLNQFDPLAHPNGPGSKFTHYVVSWER